ncbi:MFS transporter [Treponema primitia]|uniref:MFS transporter n=1 Tax=Treponema primitia TaxID=88058 RepID=UPI00025558B1|nr:MFS transporter [Treponema primitia]
MNLCLPYASVYMIALGLKDWEIGFVATIYMFTQVIFAFLGGPITDKLGRRKTTALFDFIAWSIPCLIWLRAENFWFFLVAALFNGTMKVTTNSWDCLLVEDAEKSQITRIYSLVISCGHLSALFAPISSILVSRLTLVPAIRILYINAFIVMTIKIILLYAFSRETQTGMIRVRETRGKSMASELYGYGGIVKIMLASRGTLFAILISALVGIVGMINITFWQVIVSKKIGIPDVLLPFFPMFRSILALVSFFTIIPRLTKADLRIPLLVGFGVYIIGQSILIFTPVNGGIKYLILCISLIFDGFAVGILAMLAESLVALHVDAAERARVLALLQMTIMFVSAPFGWIAGGLSGISRNLPFVLNIGLLIIGIIATVLHYRKNKEVEA